MLKTLQKSSFAELMEPSLRVLVMIAQTQAGMWRRNGYSLLNQVRHFFLFLCRSFLIINLIFAFVSVFLQLGK